MIRRTALAIALFAALPLDKLDRLSLKQTLDDIGTALPVDAD